MDYNDLKFKREELQEVLETFFKDEDEEVSVIHLATYLERSEVLSEEDSATLSDLVFKALGRLYKDLKITEEKLLNLNIS